MDEGIQPDAPNDEFEHPSNNFSRYLPGNGLPKGNKVTTPVNIEESSGFQEVTTQACDVSENEVSANKGAGCDDVTFQNAEKEEMLLWMLL